MIVIGNNNQVNIGGQVIVNSGKVGQRVDYIGDVHMTFMDGKMLVNGMTEPETTYYQISRSGAHYESIDALRADIRELAASHWFGSNEQVTKTERFGSAKRVTYMMTIRELMED